MNLFLTISKTLIAPAWAAWEHSPYLRHYRRMLKTQYDPGEVIAARQTAAIRGILRHAAATVPFWNARIEAAGLDPEAFASLDDLRRLPLLTKADLREQGTRLIAAGYQIKDLHEHKTSGSTGTSVVTYRDDACQQFKRGATLRADEWSGWRLGQRKALIWGNPQIRPDWKGRLRRALLDRDYAYLDTVKMDEPAMGRFAEVLLRTPPSMLFGHAHSLYLFAQYLQARRPDMKIRPKAILSTCMVLHDFERALIEEVFGCKVTNRYGCEEVSLIACECERHEGLHVNSDCVYVELIDQEGSPCPPGEPGRIIVTDLANRAMPMIRYEVGDMGVWAEKPCSCGRTLPLLSRIEGRVADYVVTRDGSYISGISLTENFAVQVPGVAQMQIIQEEVDRFTFNIVKGPDFGDESLREVQRLVFARFGTGTRYECVFMDRIPQEKSGKYRFCVSKVGNSFSS